jgi:hypothetical protein
MAKCTQNHTYMVEIINSPVRYVGSNADDAVNVLVTVDVDAGEEGYVVAVHPDSVYCPAESGRLENLAMLGPIH